MKSNTHFLIAVLTLSTAGVLHAQDTPSIYLQRAQDMYAKVWQRYRVAGETGLFTENFPSKGADTLTYMQGGGVKEKPVSFLWPFSGMYSATNVLLKIPSLHKKYLRYLDGLSTGMEAYKDTIRKPPGYQAYPAKFEKADRYYDDNGLVGIDYMEAYLNTKKPVYLARAKAVFAFTESGWSDTLGGGVTWLEGHYDQKPACSNGTNMLVALKIYEGSKDTYYLNWGKRFYHWMYSNLKDTNGIYANDIKMNGSLNHTFYTYNSGYMLEAAVLLYRFTDDTMYLQQAQRLAHDAYVYFGGVPHDKPFSMHIDLPWFVTVLFRGYEALYKVDGNTRYIAAIEKDLNYAWQNSRDPYGFITHSWLPKPAELSKPKWLLDEGCIAELYARLSILKSKRNNDR